MGLDLMLDEKDEIFTNELGEFGDCNRLANCPGMAGIVPELTHGVPSPGRRSFCPGNVKVDYRAWMDIWLFTNECIVFCIVFVSHTRLDLT